MNLGKGRLAEVISDCELRIANLNSDCEFERGQS